MRFVDANVFIYALTKAPREAYETPRRILKRIEEGEEAVTSTAVLQEVVDWLEYNRRKGEVEAFLTAVNSYVKLCKEAVSWEDMLTAPDYIKSNDMDYIDALTLQVMKKNNVEEIYSNDKDFDRVAWVRRVWE